MNSYSEEGDVYSHLPFVPGLELSAQLVEAHVVPVLRNALPANTPLCCARIGPGSEVLGFDTPLSRDHDWGPASRLLVLLPSAALISAAKLALEKGLPNDFAGYTLRMMQSTAKGDENVLVPIPIPIIPTNQNQNQTLIEPGTEIENQTSIETENQVQNKLGIIVSTFDAFQRSYFGFDVALDDWTDEHWLATPQQLLRAFTAGRLFVDEIGELTRARARLAYFPTSIWHGLMAARWSQLSQLQAFVGRTGSTGDELGSRLITADIVTTIMELAFLIDKTYHTYAKWFGKTYLECQS